VRGQGRGAGEEVELVKKFTWSPCKVPLNGPLLNSDVFGTAVIRIPLDLISGFILIKNSCGLNTCSKKFEHHKTSITPKSSDLGESLKFQL
jgi:hypothetical protein